MNENRLAVAAFGALVAVVLGAIAYRFIAPITVAVFLYYSTRRFHKSLVRFRLPARVRAVVSLAVLAVPLLGLISYTVVLLVVEARRFVAASDLVGVVATNVEWLGAPTRAPDLTLSGMYEAYRAGRFDVVLRFLTEHANLLTDVVTGFFLNLVITVIVTYYLLVDGARIREWLLRFDEDAIIREYLEAADAELEAVLFGNLLNVIAISIIAIGAYFGYNALVPAAVEVPYPALTGALTGVASLVPVVGMKIVYLPLAGIAALPALLAGDQSLLPYVGGFLVVAIVVVDTVPDIVLRPLLSGEETHVGLLMLAYITGPVVLGFYGLFFAPIVLVLGLTFANTAVPRLLGAEPASDSDSASASESASASASD
ncbi:MAG: AI-2E family transporter [Haloferacaceae archaeon]